jgi:hypothetical protein
LLRHVLIIAPIGVQWQALLTERLQKVYLRPLLNLLSGTLRMSSAVSDFPAPVTELCARLTGIEGVEAVALGGSRAAGMVDAESDWDIGVYYRGDIDLAPLASYGEVHPPGSWGRIMNGGAWLSLGGIKVDVLLRDIDVVQYWTAKARQGVFEIDALLGYLAGVPTYSLMAELALNRIVLGHLPSVSTYPELLSSTGERRWLHDAEFSLAHAQMRAARGDTTGTVGQSAKAVIELAQAVACSRGAWIVNEKQLLERTGLHDAHAWFSDVGTPPRLLSWLDGLRAALRQAWPQLG